MFANVKPNLQIICKCIAACGTILSYHSWLENRLQIKENKTIAIETVNEIKEQVTQHINNEVIKTEFVKRITPAIDDIKSIELLQKITDKKIQEAVENSNGELPDTVISSILKEYNEKMGELIVKGSNRMIEIEKYIEEQGFNKLVDDNPISNLIIEFKNYLSTLSIYELCILMDFFLIIIILTSLISILFAFYGNFLIEKLSLEKKYPKLSGIIKLRIKFQHYYIILNSLIIIISLIFMGYVNLVTLLGL